MADFENRGGAYFGYVSAGSAESRHLQAASPESQAAFFASLALMLATSARGVAANSVLV